MSNLGLSLLKWVEDKGGIPCIVIGLKPVTTSNQVGLKCLLATHPGLPKLMADLPTAKSVIEAAIKNLMELSKPLDDRKLDPDVEMETFGYE